MIPLYDMMANAQNGEAMQEMAHRFGLSEEQTRQAVEALMPAFSTGLKRNTQTPQDLAGFMQALSGGHHAAYFDNVGKAASPQGMAEGDGILGHLFGSREVSRAVAAQASQASGIGQEILKQMLPIIASMVMGGLFKQSTGQMGQASPQAGTGGGIFGQMMEEMMRAQNRSGAPGNQPTAGENPFGPLIEEMFGGRRSEQTASSGGRDPFDNPLGKIFRDATGGGPSPDTEDKEAPSDGAPSGRQRNPYDDIFGQMFDSGRKVQADYQRGMESIFDTYLKGMDRRR